MKKFLLLLTALCVSAATFAQEDGPSWKSKVVYSKFDVRISIGGPSGLYTYPSNVFKGAERDWFYWKSDIKLADIYEPYYELSGMPTYTAEFNYHPGKRFYVGADLSWNSMSGHQYDPVSGKKTADKKFNSAYLMGKAAIYWVQFPHCKIYSALYAGAELRQSKINGERSIAVKPAADISVFGAEWAGDIVFGFTEILAGTRMNVIKFGVGVRF